MHRIIITHLVTVIVSAIIVLLVMLLRLPAGNSGGDDDVDVSLSDISDQRGVRTSNQIPEEMSC